MSIQALKIFIDTREKYIHLFAALDQENVPYDVKKYILEIANELKMEIYNEFDNGLKLMAKNLKIKLTPDALYLLNYIIHVLIEDIITKSFTITQHRRAKRINIMDVEYALGVYPLKNSKLIQSMIKNGNKTIARVLEYKEEKTKKLTKAQTVNTYFNYTAIKRVIDTMINPHRYQTIKKGRKYKYNDIQLDTNIGIYMAALLDIFIKKLLLLSNDKTVTADVILNIIESNIEFRSFLLELFPLL